MNSDEALKSYNLGLKATNSGDFDQAEKYFLKSIKLNET